MSLFSTVACWDQTTSLFICRLFIRSQTTLELLGTTIISLIGLHDFICLQFHVLGDMSLNSQLVWLRNQQ